MAESHFNDDWRKLNEEVKKAVLRGYPNPQRIDCPGTEVLKSLVVGTLPDNHPAYIHVMECSPCHQEVFDIRATPAYRPAESLSSLYIRSAAVAAALTVISIGSWLAWRNHRLTADLAASRQQTLQHESSMRRSEEQAVSLKKQLQVLKERSSAGTVKHKNTNHNNEVSEPLISIVLWPGQSRSPGSIAGAEPIVLPNRPTRIQFWFQFEAPKYQKYELILKSVGGTEMQRVAGLQDHQLKDTSREVSTVMPSKLFTNGSYIVALVGLDPSGERRTVEAYNFTVVHRK